MCPGKEIKKINKRKRETNCNPSQPFTSDKYITKNKRKEKNKRKINSSPRNRKKKKKSDYKFFTD